MEHNINRCLNIIKANNLKIDIHELEKIKNNFEPFYSYLFKTLNSKDLDILLVNLFSDNIFVPILYSHYSYLCYKSSVDVSTYLFEYLVNNGINPHLLLESININSTNIDQYRRITSFLKRWVTPYKNEFEKENDLLYQLKGKVQNEFSCYEGDNFENLIIIPLSRKNGNEYLNYILSQLKIDNNKIEILPNGKGNFSWCFKLNDDLVLKFSYALATWYIPMFYRINDFVIRKSFGKNVISVSPYADINSVNNNDIQNALDDFDYAGLELCDGNYYKNFGLVDYNIPDSMFRDVYGITKYLDIPESDSFRKRKVKLINQDFVYSKDSKNKKYGAPIRFKR